MSTTFLELDESIGIEPSHVVDPTSGEDIENPHAGEPGPLVRQGLPFPVPVNIPETGDTVTQIQLLDIEPADQIGAVSLVPARIIPGTRIIETTSDVIAAAILNVGHYHVCDPPETQAQTRAQNAKTPEPTKAELEAQATALGIEPSGTKAEIAAAIEAHTAAQATAAEQPAPTTDPTKEG